MLTKCSHLMGYLMNVLLEQMRIDRCRKMLGSQLMRQFKECTKYGPLIQQLEFIVQQFHQLVFSGFTGVSVKGTPKLTIDCGEVTYQIGGAFNKAMRKSSDDDRYFAARSRVRDEDAESAAFCIHHADIGELEGLKIESGDKFIEKLEKVIRENNKIGLATI